MASSLSNLVNKLFEGIHRIKSTDTMIRNVKPAESHTKYVTVFLNTETLKMT